MKMKPQTASIEQQWRDYCTQVLPADVGPVQLQETRRAFYAAANAVLQVMLHLVATQEDDEAGVRILQGMHDECIAFSRAIARGEA